jgi:hypothetical protein
MNYPQDKTLLQGGCHCARVRFSVQTSLPLHVLDCNCSICRMTGFLHLIVPKTAFTLLTGENELTEYRFNTGAARHFFCKHCGIKPFYVPRSHPDGIDVNARCLDGVSLDDLIVEHFDDNNREAATAAIAHLSQ